MTLEVEDGINFAIGQWIGDLITAGIGILVALVFGGLVVLGVGIFEWISDRRNKE